MHAADALEREIQDLTAVDILHNLDDQIQAVIDQLADLQHVTQANRLHQVQREIRDLVDALVADDPIEIGQLA
mgnify:CR=1 FL=1